ncbi:MAG: hypothetical protein R3F19_28255 [Verrucomicrobiales bacterium]
MGISTVASYRGAQIFRYVGLNHEVIDKYFCRTASRVEGIGLDVIAEEIKMRHDDAFKSREVENDALDPGGLYQWRADGERHLFNPQTIHLLQQATRLRDYALFRKYSELIDDQSRDFYTLRGLVEFSSILTVRSRSRKSNQLPKSSSASRLGRCLMARSRKRRTRLWQWP